MSAAVNKINQPGLIDLQKQIEEDVQSYRTTASRVHWECRGLTYRLLPETPRDVDVFDLEKNIRDVTLTYSGSWEGGQDSSVRDFPRFFEESLYLLQTVLSDPDPGEIRVVRVTADLLKGRDLVKNFSYDRNF